MRLELTDILFTYILAKTEKLKSLKLECNDYCLCIEIPFKVKLNEFRYSTFPCVERKDLQMKKKLKHLVMDLKYLYIFLKNT